MTTLQSFLSTLLSDLEVVSELSSDVVVVVTDNARLTWEQAEARKERFAINDRDASTRQQQKNRWSSWDATCSRNTANACPRRRRASSDSLLNRPMRASSPERVLSSTSSERKERQRPVVVRQGSCPLPVTQDHDEVVVDAPWGRPTTSPPPPLRRKNRRNKDVNESHGTSLPAVDSVTILRNQSSSKSNKLYKKNGIPSTCRTQKNEKVKSSSPTASTKALCVALGPMAPPSKIYHHESFSAKYSGGITVN